MASRQRSSIRSGPEYSRQSVEAPWLLSNEAWHCPKSDSVKEFTSQRLRLTSLSQSTGRIQKCPKSRLNLRMRWARLLSGAGGTERPVNAALTAGSLVLTKPAILSTSALCGNSTRGTSPKDARSREPVLPFGHQATRLLRLPELPREGPCGFGATGDQAGSQPKGALYGASRGSRSPQDPPVAAEPSRASHNLEDPFLSPGDRDHVGLEHGRGVRCRSLILPGDRSDRRTEQLTSTSVGTRGDSRASGEGSPCSGQGVRRSLRNISSSSAASPVTLLRSSQGSQLRRASHILAWKTPLFPRRIPVDWFV